MRARMNVGSGAGASCWRTRMRGLTRPALTDFKCQQRPAVFDDRRSATLGTGSILRRDRGRFGNLGVEPLEVRGGAAVVARSVWGQEKRHGAGDAEERDDSRVRGNQMKKG